MPERSRPAPSSGARAASGRFLGERHSNPGAPGGLAWRGCLHDPTVCLEAQLCDFLALGLGVRLGFPVPFSVVWAGASLTGLWCGIPWAGVHRVPGPWASPSPHTATWSCRAPAWRLRPPLTRPLFSPAGPRSLWDTSLWDTASLAAVSGRFTPVPTPHRLCRRRVTGGLSRAAGGEQPWSPTPFGECGGGSVWPCRALAPRLGNGWERLWGPPGRGRFLAGSVTFG